MTNVTYLKLVPKSDNKVMQQCWEEVALGIKERGIVAFGFVGVLPDGEITTTWFDSGDNKFAVASGASKLHSRLIE